MAVVANRTFSILFTFRYFGDISPLLYPLVSTVVTWMFWIHQKNVIKLIYLEHTLMFDCYVLIYACFLYCITVFNIN